MGQLKHYKDGKWVTDSSIGSGGSSDAEAYADKLKSETDADIADLQNQLNSTNDYIDGAFDDGIISRIELEKIRAHLKSLEESKTRYDAQYTKIYNNPDIDATSKSALQTAKQEYNNSFQPLEDFINALTDNETVTTAMKTTWEDDYSRYLNAVDVLSSALEVSIDNIAKAKADGAEANAKDYTDSSLSPIQETVTSNSSQITENKNEIALKVDQTTYTTDITGIQNNITDLQTTTSDTNTYIDGAFKDGIIQDAEYRKIESYLNTLASAKADYDNQYSSVDGNSYLTGVDKTNLESAKSGYDDKYNALVTEINNAIADQKATPDETTGVDNAFSDYQGAIALLATMMQAAIDAIAKAKANEAETNAKNYADQLKTDTDSSINDVSQSVTDLNTYVDGSFKDGVITQTESNKIKAYLNTIANTKSNFDQKYNAIYGNTQLTGTLKTTVATDYTNFTNAYNDLVTSINNAIADDAITTTESSDVDSKFSAFNSATGTLQAQLDFAIDYIANAKATSAQNTAQDYADAQIQPIDTRLTTAESNISENANNITLKVNQTDYEQEITGINQDKVNSQFAKNVAVNKSVTYTGGTEANGSPTAQQDYGSGRWNLDLNTLSLPQSMTVDLGAIVDEVVNVNFTSYPTNVVTATPDSFTVEYSTDNANWSKVVDISGNTNTKVTYNTAETSVRYVRLTITKGQSATSVIKITNFQVISYQGMEKSDALKMYNGPAEAGADVTGNNTANDTSHVNGTPAVDITTRLTEAESSITQNANNITLKVDQTTYDQKIGQLQDQIDGVTTDWFYSYAPTLSNAPASTWTDNATKDNHIGDLFYDLTTGYSYRFVNQSGYQWLRITDSDVTRALANAATAQDTADSKRRNFTSQPVAPYDIGDLWSNGQTIYRCTKAEPTGANFSSSDWQIVGDVTSQNTAYDTARVGGTSASDINSRLTNAESSISQNADAITLRVTTTTYNQGIADTKDYADNSASTAVDNLKVGGRNLVGKFNAPQGVTEGLDNGESGWGIVLPASTSGNPHTFGPMNLKTNQDYMVSFLIWCDSGTVTVENDLFPDTLPQLPNLTVTTTPKKYTIHVSPQSSSDMSAAYLRFWDYNVNGSNGPSSPVYISDVKLEEGTKATAWSPAPEDLQAYSDSASRRTDILPVRYIRDWLNNNTINNANHWIEIQAWAGQTNRASGATVTGSTTSTNQPLSVITDGNISSSNYTTIGSGFQYAEVDLGAIYDDIDFVKVWHYYGDGRTYHGTKTEVSADGTNWISIFDSSHSSEYAETASGRAYKVNGGTANDTANVGGTPSTQINSRLSSAESSITQNANNIALKVSTTDYNGNTIASLINQSATTVSISASKINLNGAVTITDLDSSTSTKVNNGDSAKSTLDSKASVWDAKETPSGAQSKADTAQSNAESYTQGYAVPTMAYRTANTVSGYSNYYAKIGSSVISGQYQYTDVDLHFTGGAAGNSDGRWADIHWRVKQQASMGSAPGIQVDYKEGQWFNPSDFVAVTVTNSSAKTQVDLYVRIRSTYEQLGFTPLNITIDTPNHMTWYSESALVASLPSGTQTVGTDRSYMIWAHPGTTEIDGGNIYTNSITANQIAVGAITAASGIIHDFKWDVGYGGTITLGGNANQNGNLIVLDANGESVADIGYDNGGFGSLSVGQLTSPSIYNVNREDLNLSTSSDGGITECLAQVPNLNEGVVTIDVHANIADDVTIQNFLGNGSIIIDLHGWQVDGQFHIQGCAPTYIYIHNGIINGNDSGGSVVHIDRCTYVSLASLYLYGNNVAEYGVYAHAGSGASIQDCQIYDVTNDCIASATSAHVTAQDNKGLGGAWGMHAFTGGIIVGNGTCPEGTSGNTLGASGQILGSFTPNAGAATPPAPPSTTTTITSSSADNWSTSGYWDGTNEAKQGNWGYGTRTGLWFFGSDIYNVVHGKTIKSMKLYVSRLSSGGYSSSVTIRVRWHTYTSRPSGAPSDLSLSSDYVDISLAWGANGWVTIPSSFYADFATGSARGFGIYYDGSSSHYAVMSHTAKVQVVYA